MSVPAMWKMLYLLYNASTPALSTADLHSAGIVCDPDAIQPVVDTGLVEFQPPDRYKITRAGRDLLRDLPVVNKRWAGGDLWVDYPEVFVVMPFSEPWSKDVFETIIQPAIQTAGLVCERGDTFPRVGDLTQNIWNQIMRAGVVVAEVSSPNVNVFYEIGIVHAIGKDALLFKQKGAPLPADFGGAHYNEYDPNDKESARRVFREQLEGWAARTHTREVRRIYGK